MGGISYYVRKAIYCNYSKETSHLCKRALRAEHFKVEKKMEQKPKTKHKEQVENTYEPKPNRRKPSKRRQSRKQKDIQKKKKEERREIRIGEHSVYQRGTCGSNP